MNVLSLYDRTTTMVKPWAQAGYNCVCADIQHRGTTEHQHGAGRIITIGADLREWVPPLQAYFIVFACPPCTNLAVSGARWFREKGLSGLHIGVELVQRAITICQASGDRWMIENPVSTLSSYWRKPDYTFDPLDYAGYLDDPAQDAYTKKTCLWTGPEFTMPEPIPVRPGPDADRIHTCPPTDDRGDVRSATPEGFARAVFLAHHMEPQLPARSSGRSAEE